MNGDPCDGAGDCGPGFECINDQVAGGMFCSAECVPFDGVDDCDGGWFCYAVDESRALCFPPTTSGTQQGEQCSPGFQMCAEDRLCRETSPGNAVCLSRCRTAEDDADCPEGWMCISVDGPTAPLGECLPAG